MEATLRESEATIRALLETAAQSILAVDLNGAVVLANRMAEEMFGYGRGELLGMPLEKLLPERLRARHLSHRAEFAASPRTRPMGVGLDLQGLRKDGTEFPIEVSLSTVQTSRGTLAVAFVTDITQAEASGDVASEQRERAASACQKPAYGAGGRTPASCPGSSRRCHSAAGAPVHRDRQVGGWNFFVGGRNKQRGFALSRARPATHPTKSGGCPTVFIRP